jgi:hypothetical protein
MSGQLHAPAALLPAYMHNTQWGAAVPSFTCHCNESVRPTLQRNLGTCFRVGQYVAVAEPPRSKFHAWYEKTITDGRTSLNLRKISSNALISQRQYTLTMTSTYVLDVTPYIQVEAPKFRKKPHCLSFQDRSVRRAIKHAAATYSSTLKLDAVSVSETSVTTYHSTRRLIPDVQYAFK